MRGLKSHSREVTRFLSLFLSLSFSLSLFFLYFGGSGAIRTRSMYILYRVIREKRREQVIAAAREADSADLILLRWSDFTWARILVEWVDVVENLAHSPALIVPRKTIVSTSDEFFSSASLFLKFVTELSPVAINSSGINNSNSYVTYDCFSGILLNN